MATTTKNIAQKIKQANNVTSNDIIIKNARTHNLKNVSVTIPRNKLVVVTGVSGSGKCNNSNTKKYCWQYDRSI